MNIYARLFGAAIGKNQTIFENATTVFSFGTEMVINDERPSLKGPRNCFREFN